MSKLVIPESQYKEDLSRGYTVLEWQSRRSKRVRDLRTGQMIEVQRVPMKLFRCMECQFDTGSEELMGKHLSIGNHDWPYQDGNTPYGPLYQIEIENSGGNV